MIYILYFVSYNLKEFLGIRKVGGVENFFWNYRMLVVVEGSWNGGGVV